MRPEETLGCEFAQRSWVDDIMIDVLTIGGPVAALAIMSIYINYRLTLRWMLSYESTIKDVTRALGEVNESLRRLNGKH